MVATCCLIPSARPVFCGFETLKMGFDSVVSCMCQQIWQGQVSELLTVHSTIWSALLGLGAVLSRPTYLPSQWRPELRSPKRYIFIAFLFSQVGADNVLCMSQV